MYDFFSVKIPNMICVRFYVHSVRMFSSVKKPYVILVCQNYLLTFCGRFRKDSWRSRKQQRSAGLQIFFLLCIDLFIPTNLMDQAILDLMAIEISAYWVDCRMSYYYKNL